MATELGLDRACDWMRLYAAEIAAQKEYLTQLDAAIGDADHGINMDRGFTAVRAALDATPPFDLGALFTLAGRTLISTVGGASGPLYGTAFLRLGGALAGKTAAGVEDLAAALALACDGVAARGRSACGEKTMLDAFGPAVEAFQAAAGRGRTLMDGAAAAAAAAEDGARATIPLRAMRGRASFLGEHSIGHQDPGATSTALLFRALATVVAA
ncbi:MAG TPA: dihydroxyacetone kinase subunit DhaL [Chloroflexota bacterium]|nr:dihydroxyacetone kinase subunit DhaL [Chloroflexota bacterium]